MFLVTVYPIIRGAFKEELTYWSAQPIVTGALIDVPFRSKTIPALVGQVIPAQDIKSQIKNASFSIKKIQKTKEKFSVRSECVNACLSIADEYLAATGSILKACIPDIAFESKISETKDDLLTDEQKAADKAEQDEMRVTADVVVYQTNYNDRISTYKSIVREEFARKKSVLIIAPTVASAEDLFVSLKKGIDEYASVIHGRLSKKKQLIAWDKALEDDHPRLIITTPLFACIPRKDVSTFILEKESSRGYSAMHAPFMDFRDYIVRYAKNLGTRLILGDSMLRIETLYRREIGELADFFPISYRIEKTADVLVVNSKENKKQAKATVDVAKAGGPTKADNTARNERPEKKEFRVLSEELVSMIEYADKKHDNMFIFGARKGLAPQTVCGDCGQSVICDVCQAPVVLHENKKLSSETDKNNMSRYFLCHHCGKQRSAMEACMVCKSWKLITLGIGIDTIAQEVKKLFPKKSIFMLDRDTATTDKQAKDIVEEFKTSAGGVMIGTESALAFLPELKYTAIASLDTLFSIPDFRIHERIMHILLRILEQTTAYMLIQTRSDNAQVLSHFTSGNLSQFYKEEIEMRHQIQYPPFAKHIKITIEETRSVATEHMKKLQDMVDQIEEKEKGPNGSHSTTFSSMVFPAFVPGSKGKSILHMLISIKPEAWPHHSLKSLLRSLPPEYQVRVNPESLL